MKRVISIIIALGVVLGSAQILRAEDGLVTGQCEELREKIAIIIPLQKVVSYDFSRINDPMLCESMREQCEYFYSKAKGYQKEYRKQCESDYDMVEIDKCDYSENPCVKPRIRRLHAGLY